MEGIVQTIGLFLFGVFLMGTLVYVVSRFNRKAELRSGLRPPMPLSVIHALVDRAFQPLPIPSRPVDRALVLRLIEEALDAQRSERDRMRADPMYWGGMGDCVASALSRAERVLAPPPVGRDVFAWLHERRDALRSAHENYRREADDPDGYGSATFHELQRALEEIYERFA